MGDPGRGSTYGNVDRCFWTWQYLRIGRSAIVDVAFIRAGRLANLDLAVFTDSSRGSTYCQVNGRPWTWKYL